MWRRQCIGEGLRPSTSQWKPAPEIEILRVAGGLRLGRYLTRLPQETLPRRDRLSLRHHGPTPFPPEPLPSISFLFHCNTSFSTFSWFPAVFRIRAPLRSRTFIPDGIFPPGFFRIYAHHLDCFHSTLASHSMCVYLTNAKMVRLTGSCLETVADLDGRNSGIHRKALYCAGAQGLPSSLAAIAAELRDGLRSACTHPLVRFTSFYMLSSHADLLLDPGLWCGETKLSPAIWSLHPELSTEMIVVKSGMEVSSLGWTTKTSHHEVRLAG